MTEKEHPDIAMQIRSEEVNLEAAEEKLTATQDKSNVKQVGYDLTNIYHPILIITQFRLTILCNNQVQKDIE